MILTRAARNVLLAAVVSIAPACDRPGSTRPTGAQDVPAHTESGEPPNLIVWGCDKAIPELNEHPDPDWREDSIVVGDFGFLGMAGNFSGFRPHERADIQVKLPVIIEGHTRASVWIPQPQRSRAALILADVSRRGFGNSYRIEDGHLGVTFAPCANKEWSAWTAGLALADQRAIVLMIEPEGARPTRVSLGPWET